MKKEVNLSTGLDFICHAMDEVAKNVRPGGVPGLAVRSLSVSVWLEYFKIEEESDRYNFLHTVFCLTEFRKLKSALIHEPPPLTDESLMLVQFALLCAWAKKNRKASALWTSRKLQELTNGDRPDMEAAVFDLVLVVRAKKSAETREEGIIARIGLLGDEREKRESKKHHP
ncbi:hypothetical protein KGM48_01400 [Patescibacteria group bacterium]|nr:hypothetical protein [Patescibacteria group bacterium]